MDLSMIEGIGVLPAKQPDPSERKTYADNLTREVTTEEESDPEIPGQVISIQEAKRRLLAPLYRDRKGREPPESR